MGLAWDDGRLLRGARGRYLRAHKLCERCLKSGRERIAAYVDFIEAPGRDKEKYWDRNNWIALCVQCEREEHNAEIERWKKERAASALLHKGER